VLKSMVKNQKNNTTEKPENKQEDFSKDEDAV
jgi:hypothetical protein